MSLRLPRAARRLIGVAAGFLAATLSAQACEADTRSGLESSHLEDTGGQAEVVPIELPTRWLVPADPDLKPPLAAPLDIAADEKTGRLLVLESQPPELRAYSVAGGELLHVMGREGDGPGEYRHPIGVAVNGDGVAAVLGVGGRVTFWREDGLPAGVVQAGPGLASEIIAARGDTFYVKSDLFPPDDVSEFRPVTFDTALGIARYRDLELVGESEPNRGTRNHAYAVAATADGDLLLSPPGPDYVILRIDPAGEVSQRIVRPEIAALERAAEEIEAIRQRVRKGFAIAGRPTPEVIPVPEYRPHLGRLTVASDGSIWGLTHRGDGNASVLDCFDSDGRFTATYVVRRRVTDIAVTSGYVYLLARGDYDVYGVAVAKRPANRGVNAASR